MCITRTPHLSHGVQDSYIGCMSKLQTWMNKNGQVDADVARSTRLSRPQISRIRRGIHTASEKTARRLEALTGIKWWHFMTIEKKPAAKKAKV